MGKQTKKAKARKQRYLRLLREGSGRPGEYQPHYVMQAESAAGLGATERQLAKIFLTTVNTLRKWYVDHPEFLVAIERGRDDPDNQVERALFQNAINGDTRACWIWLSNRRPHKWRNQQGGQLPPQDAGSDATLDQIRAMPSDKLRRLLNAAPPGEAKVIDLVPVAGNGTNGNGKH